ncbi:acyl-CoA dehydrogenase family protein [Pseudorhodoferax sp. Leaf274]|uniref:acyl-CoA dehydrogenase family protein n=1 Tax=Pseudorhodoferax sp. Leaf274 TaxID=1736318 RepID=UPI000702DA49|nr:acyl-CoA dehydrogenase family protein [Pseudorhodoferax sp. Leaf274]KQP49845.1 monooxygenase [Pseudorhodoferax sp. Leaf274]
MTQHHLAWGAAPSPRYEGLAQRFRPVFQRIRDTAVERDLQHRLPHEELHWLRAEGFARLRLPVEQGGAGATLTEFFGLLVELGAADTNVVNALRAHFGFTEDVLHSDFAEFRAHWLGRIAEGQTIGSGFSESGDAKVGSFATTLTRDAQGQLRLSGRKFYTTGSLFADWINTAADDEHGQPTLLLVPRKAPGVQVDDDWDGFGQALTASGTAHFDQVAIEPAWVNPSKARFPYSSAYYQLVHLASLAGIARALSEDLAQRVRERTRTYSHANAGRSAQDPQVLQVVGLVHGAAYGANAIVQQAARALEHAWQARTLEAATREQANVLAHVEVDQAVPVVTQLVLDASTQLFDALGASAALRPAGLDRYWRNARTIASHNPRVYRERQAGDYAVNGTPPPTFYRVGTA